VTDTTIPSVQFASVVYGDGVPLDDSAETYHEAAKLYPCSAGGENRGFVLLERHPGLQQSIERASRRRPHRPRVTLPDPVWPDSSCAAVLAARRSSVPARAGALTLCRLSTILAATYRADPLSGGRPIPSGGALYPLELYPLVLDVDGADPGVYHYDPYDHCVERLDGDLGLLPAALVEPALAERSSLIVVFTGVFWRSRFKYGARGYRFTLLEAGHAAQNALLAAAALGLDALPLGAFYDTRVETIVGVNGVDESVVYAIAFGTPGARA
jgi:SagB-type dehydrogenase family enzyme